MKKIRLTQGKYALVDDEDFNYLNSFKWHSTKITKSAKTCYAVRNQRQNGIKKNITMHRFLMNFPVGKQIDHKDGNGLNNQRENLRICNSSENHRNGKIRVDNTSGYKGVTWHKKNKKWQTGLTVLGKYIFIGMFDGKKEAAMAYNKEAKKLFKEFAKLNNIT